MEHKQPRQGGVSVADQKRTSPEVEAQVVALLGQGVTQREVARVVGLPPNTIYRIRKRNKVGVVAAALNLDVGSKGWRKQELARLYSLVADNPSKRDPLDIIDAFRKEEEAERSPSLPQAYNELIQAMRALAAPKLIDAPYTVISDAGDA